MKEKLIKISPNDEVEVEVREKGKKTGVLQKGKVIACYKRRANIKFADQEKLIERKFVKKKL